MKNAALLIGNSRYDPLPPLHTPIGDVRNLAAVVRRLGFDTDLVEDASLHGLHHAVAGFREKVAGLSEGGSVFVYFAGHGVQSAGENYLIPVDAVAPSGGGWRLRALDLSSLLEELCWRPDQQKLIALDACRTNGILSTVRGDGLGLCGVSEERYSAVCETMILYAAKPGQVASDGAGLGTSPFCRALLDVFDGTARPLPVLAPEITRNTKAYTGGEQIPWYTSADLTELATVPFWGVADGTDDAINALDRTSVTSEGLSGTEESRAIVPVVSGANIPAIDVGETSPTSAGSRIEALVALRQQMGRNRWRWMVLGLRAENRSAFFRLAGNLLDLDRQHHRPQRAGIAGDMLDTLLGAPVSAFELDALAQFGSVLCHGEGKDVPAAIRAELAKRFGAVFDWSDWEQSNGAMAELP